MRRAGAGVWARRVGALVLWAAAESLFVFPRLGAPGALTPSGYRPLLAPLVGVVVNAWLAVAFVWWFVVRVLARREWGRAARFRLRAPPPGVWPWVAAAAVAIVVGVNAAFFVLPRVLSVPPDGDPFVAAYLRQPYGPVAFAVLAVAVAPLVEEFFFRGWLQRGLERRLPPWAAIVITALLFAAAHLQRFGFAPRVGFALASGYAAWVTRSIWPSVGLHAAYNGGLLAAGAFVPFLARADERSLPGLAREPRVFWPALALLAVSTAVAAWALRGVRATAVAARVR